MKKKIVITNHTDKFIEWYDILLNHGYTRDNIVIYDRDHPGFNGINLDPKRIEKYGTVIKTRNVGTSIYIMGKYILDNYDNLPDYTIFLKCNLLQNNYTSKEIFESALDANYYYPIHADILNSKYPQTTFLVNDYIYVEKISDEIYTESKVFPRLKTISDFMKDIFEIKVMPQYLAFAPGGNYVVPKENILKYSKNFYKKFMYYTDYTTDRTIKYGPDEAHWFERILDLAWKGNLKENMSYIIDDNKVIN